MIPIPKKQNNTKNTPTLWENKFVIVEEWKFWLKYLAFSQKMLIALA